MKRSVSRFAIVALGLLVATIGSADKIDDYIKSEMKEREIPGMSVIVVKDGKTIKEAGYGLADLEQNVPVTKDTVFEIGSVTKQFTAAAIMLLVEAGKIDLDGSITKYVDDLPEVWKPITVRQCLTHTSGLKDYLATFFSMRKDYKQTEILDLVRKSPLDFEPGSAWSYSNTGYYLLGMAIEKVSGKSYDEFLQEKVLKPLKLEHTRSCAPSELIPHRAHGYTIAKNFKRNSETLRPSAGYSAGDLVSTVGDMAKWEAALASGKLLKPESLKVIWSPVRLNSGRPYDYGFGWFLTKLRSGHQVIEHGGNTFGFSAMITRFPDDHLTVVCLANAAGQSYSDISLGIAEELMPGIAPKPLKPSPDPKPSRTEKVAEALRRIMQGTATAEYLDPEMLGLLGTVRGKGMSMGLKAGLGALESLTYLDQQPEGDDTSIWYEGKFEKAKKVNLKLLVSKEGKLVRIDLDR